MRYIPYTLDTRLLELQYKLRNKCLVTNSFLCKIGVFHSPLCSFCGEMDETVVHTFWFCRYSTRLWAEVIKWLSNRLLRIKQSVILPQFQMGQVHWIFSDLTPTLCCCVYLFGWCTQGFPLKCFVCVYVFGGGGCACMCRFSRLNVWIEMMQISMILIKKKHWSTKKLISKRYFHKNSTP